MADFNYFDSIKAISELNQLLPNANGLMGAVQEGDDISALSQVEQDVATLSPLELMNKYGIETASKLLLEKELGDSRYRSNRNIERSIEEAVADSISGFGQGFVNSVLSLATIPVATISDAGSQQMAEWQQRFNDYINSEESSYALQRRKEALQARRAIQDANSEGLYQRDLAEGKSKLMASISKIGRDAINAADAYTDDPVIAGQETATGIGSLFAMGAVGKTASAIKALEKIGSKVIKTKLDKYKWQTTGALMEGGGAYSDAVNTVMNTPTEQLYQTSPEFVSLVQENLSKGMELSEAEFKAKQELATDVGIKVAPIAGATAFGLNKFTSGLEQVMDNPLAKRTKADIISNLLGEALEEGGVGLSGQLAQNIAVQQDIDPNQDITEGVGEQLGVGATFGLTTAGSVHAPGVAKDVTKATAKATIKAVDKGLTKAFTSRQDAVEAKDENSVDKIAIKIDELSKQFSDLNDSYQQSNASDEMKAKVGEQIKNINEEVLHISDKEKEFLSSGSKEIVNKATNRLDALQQLVHKIDRTNDKKERILLEDDFITLYNELSRAEIDDSLNDAEPVTKMKQLYADLDTAIKSSPQLNRILQASLKTQEEISEKTEDISEEDFKSKEGKVKINAVVNTAINNGTKVNLPVLDKILAHITKDGISNKFSASTKKGLATIRDIINIENQFLQDKINAGLIPKDFLTDKAKYYRKKQFAVHENVVAGNDSIYSSERLMTARQHAHNIIKNYLNNDLESAKNQLALFEQFVKSQENKAVIAEQALQNGFATGEYETWNPREQVSYKAKITINSQDLAKEIIKERDTLYKIQEAIYQHFPELGLEESIEGTDVGGQPIDIQNTDTTVNTQTETQIETKTVQEKVEAKQEVKTKKEKTVLPSQENKTLAEQEQLAQNKFEQEHFGTTAEEQNNVISEINAIKKEDRTKEQQETLNNALAKLKEIKEGLAKFGINKAVKDVISNSLRKNFTVTNKSWFSLSNNPIKDLYNNLIQGNIQNNKVLSRIDDDREYWETELNPNDKDSMFSIIKNTMQDNLFTWGSTNYSKDKKIPRMDVILETVKDGESPWFTTKPNTKLLNLIQFNEEQSEIIYSDYFLDHIVLGSMSWLLNNNNFFSKIEYEDVPFVFGHGIDFSDLTDYEINTILETYGQFELVNSLKRYIKRYLGLKPNKEATEEDVDGLYASIAAETLTALIDAGYIRTVDLNAQKMEFDEKLNKEVLKTYTVPRYYITDDLPILSYKEAIDNMVLKEPEQTIYYDNAKIPVPNTYLHSSEPLTEKSKEAIKNRQEESYTINDLYAGFLMGLGDAVQDLFNVRIDDESLYNKQDLLSKKGKRNALLDSIKYFKETYADMRSYAEAIGKDVLDVEKHYAYELSAVNRLQMRGYKTPQGDKPTRQLITSTNSKEFDMTNKDNEDLYYIALGQAFGIKVHNKYIDDKNILNKVVKGIRSEVDEMLSIVDAELKDELTNYIKEYREYANKGNVELEDRYNSKLLTQKLAIKIRNAFNKAGMDITDLSIHAYLDHLNFEYAKANNEDLTKYNTRLSIEADGVTNGIANFVVTSTPSQFTKKWLDTVSKIGLAIGSSKYNSLADIRHDPDHPDHKEDIYTTGANDFVKNIKAFRQNIANQKNAKFILPVVNNLYELINRYTKGFNYSIKSWTNDDWNIGRNAVKNPLTVLVYGAGNRRISINFTQGLVSGSAVYGMTGIYKHMSDALHELVKQQANGEKLNISTAFFPEYKGNDVLAKKAFYTWLAQLNSLITVRYLFNEKTGKYFAAEDSKVTGIPAKFFQNPRNIQNFKLTRDQIANLEANIHLFFGNELGESLRDTIGSDVMEATKVFIDSTNFMSKVNAALTRAAEQSFIKAKISRGEPASLSREDKNKIADVLKDTEPRIILADGDMVAVVQGRVKSKKEIGSSLSGKIKGWSEVFEKGDPGVKGIPFMNISHDGHMMQKLSGEKQTRDIFDGMDMALINARRQSQAANKAVEGVWEQNRYKDIKTAFDKLVAYLNNHPNAVEDLSKDSRFVAYIKEFISVNDKLPFNSALDLALNYYQNQLQEYSDQVEVRHNVLKACPMMIDQMASLGKGYKTKTAEEYLDIPQDVVLSALQDMYTSGMENPNGNEPTITFTEAVSKYVKLSEPVKQEPKKQVKKRKLSVARQRELEFKEIFKDLNTEQKRLFNTINRIIGKNKPTIVVGSREEILKSIPKDQYARVVKAFNDGADAMYDSSVNTIYSTTDDPTIVLHELIHATTFNIINAYYNGEKVSAEVEQAIKRLEILAEDLYKDINIYKTLDSKEPFKNEFLNSEWELQRILSGLKQSGNKAEYLNEFMAYVLSNPALMEAYKKRKVPALYQKLKDFFKALKTLIFGSAKVAIPKDNDFISHVRFNTLILAKKQATLFDSISDNVLMHTSTNNNRVTHLLSQFKSLISDTLAISTNLERIKINTAVLKAKNKNVASVIKDGGFNLNQEQKDTYQYIVASYEAGLKLNTDYLNEISRIYDHVIKHMVYEDFMRNPTGSDPNDIKQAVDKYNYVKGLTHNYDQLSEFIALAQVSDEFRKVLTKVPMIPKMKSSANTSIDRLVENLGFGLLERLSHKILQFDKPTTTQATIDKLVTDLYITTKQQQANQKIYSNIIGNNIDKANDMLVNSIDFISHKTEKLGQKLATSDNKYIKSIGKQIELASYATQKNHENDIKEAAIKLMNNKITDKIPLSTLAKDIFSDIIGYTRSSAPVTNMIKLVKFKIQQFRQNYKDIVPATLLSRFNKKLSANDLEVLHKIIGKADLSALASRGFKDVITLLSSKQATDSELKLLLNQITDSLTKDQALLVQKKMNQLANFMITGNVGKEGRLLRNAYAIADLATNKQLDSKLIDEYVSIKAYTLLSEIDKKTFIHLAKTENKGVFACYSYISNLKYNEELNTEDRIKEDKQDRSYYNYYKGYIPLSHKENYSIIVADKKDRLKLERLGYEYKTDYEGYGLTGIKAKAYFVAPFNNRVSFTEGVMQTAALTRSGVNRATGRSLDNIAGTISNPRIVKILNSKSASELPDLIPVFNNEGIIVAYERSTDPLIMEEAYKQQDLTKSLGIWMGRVQEELLGQETNKELINNLYDMWKKAELTSDADMFVDLYSLDDPIIKDALSIINYDTLDYIKEKFGSNFMVRKDLIKDVLGERHASIGDLWTGNTRWSKETQQVVQKATFVVIGPKAYRYLTTAEKWAMGTVSLARNNIVVRSLIVPALNIASNLKQLIYRGVPISRFKDIPEKIRELEIYIRCTRQIIDLEIQQATLYFRSAERNYTQKRIDSLKAQIQTLSIAPLLNQGEFSTVADVGASQEDLEFSPGKLGEYMENAFNKLPTVMQTVGKNIFLTKDTALYRATEKTVQYGDFVAKALLFDHLTKDKGISQEEALQQIREEFVDYDKLAGRNRQYLEDIGLLWFYNYKLRMTKVALSILKNNPLHALIGLAFLPDDSIIGNIGDPLTDNVLAKAFDGKLGYSIGPAMLLSGAELHPTANFVSSIF